MTYNMACHHRRPEPCWPMLLLLLQLVTQAAGISWLLVVNWSSVSHRTLLSLGMAGTTFTPDETLFYSPKDCKMLIGLNRRQIKLCKRHIEHMDSVRVGAHLAIVECQWQFRQRRWNCTMVDSVNLFGDVFGNGTREAAFVNAISSAAVAQQVTADCSLGKLDKCGCDQSVRGRSPRGFRWSGCSDNVHYGIAFSRKFVDAYEKQKEQPVERMLMNLHNNDAGRMAVAANMRLQCKCHGVSGSCELKTCWRAMPSFREIGDIVKDKFDGATEVRLARSTTRRSLSPVNPSFKMPTENDLVYLEGSPDFCERNESVGLLGTQGRPCNASSQGIDGCDLLCCRRGYDTKIIEVVERCACKFHWCCEVRCKECIRRTQQHTCR